MQLPAFVLFMASVAEEMHNPVLPQSSELAYALVALLVPLSLVVALGLVVRQVIRNRQAVERDPSR